MNRRLLALVVMTFLLLLPLMILGVAGGRIARQKKVSPTAVLVAGRYLDCDAPNVWGFGQPCRVYAQTTGELLNLDPFSLRLKDLSLRRGGVLVDCGTTPARKPSALAAECVRNAFRTHRPFTVEYVIETGTFTRAYGLAGDTQGAVMMASYASGGFPPVPPTRRTMLLDGNRVRVTPCVEPVTLETGEDDVVGCVTPISDESSSARTQKPIDTTVCAIVDNPPAFNNKLVRVHGHYSGNFEYSMLSGDGCSDSIWFQYGGDDSPPGLAVHISGSAMPGGEDATGKLIPPIPVKLVRDQSFKRFQQLMEKRAKLEDRSMRQESADHVSYEVTATFVGRIDGVSPEVHEFHRKRNASDRADYLGFGHMGLFDAQFVLQSVEGDAVLETKR